MKKICIIGIMLLTGMMFRAEAQTTLVDALRLLQQKNYIEAMDVCNALLAESTNDASALGVRSQAHTAMGNFDLATQDADKALSIDNSSYRALIAKADVLFHGQRDFKQALQQYDAAIKANAQLTEAHAGKARTLMAMQNNRDAMRTIEDAIKTSFRNDAELLFIRGLLNFQRGNHRQAVDDYDLSLSANASWNPFQVFLNRGLANDAQSKPDIAIQDFSKAIIADPNNAGGYLARGNVLYALSRFSDAVEDYLRAEVLNPDNNVITYNIGMSYQRNNDRAAACRYFQKSCTQGNANACRSVVLNCTDRRTN